jgi:hypothetical protein
MLFIRKEKAMAKSVLLAVLVLVGALQAGQAPAPASAQPTAGQASPGAVAEVYFWKAKPGKLDDYTRYIREFAEPIDMDAGRHGAFVSVTTYVNSRPDAPWTHMRVFVLNDRAQQAALFAALDAAKLRLHPDEAERTRMAAYSETLRDLAGHETLDVMH